MTNELLQYTKTPNNLFGLLSRYRVVVPGIQRHYVQGADNPRAKNIRENFIAELLSAIKNGKELHLHFIYGPINTEGEDAFVPVDGQQRLTTLWLLARYAVEFIDQDEKGRVLNLLSRFTYADRINATRFCKALTALDATWNCEKDPHDSILAQVWFWDYWKEDETVSSMLRMLSTIHNKWQELKQDLTGINVLEALANNVVFGLKFDSFGDDIYMKMNARGLQLTQWENFKGKFAAILSHSTDTHCTDFVKQYRVKQSFDINKYSIKAIWDNQIEALSNLFFEKTTIENELPDNAFFALFARLLVYISKKECGKQIEELASFRSNTELPYVPLDEFLELLRTFNQSELDEFAIKYIVVIENVINHANICAPYWSERRLIDTFFHPKEINDLDFSLCCFEYFSRFPNVNDTDMYSAMRFVWNILENVGRQYISDSDDKHGVFNRVKTIINCADIGDPSLYPVDAKNALLSSKNLSSQLEEEYEKAIQIHSDNQQIPDNWNEELGPWKGWNDAIQQAESTVFFKGTIRHLFVNGEGNIDWTSFAVKFTNSKKYFDENGVKDENGVNYASDCILLRAVLSRCKDFWEQMWWSKTILNNTSSTWKSTFLTSNRNNDVNWWPAIDVILHGDLSINEEMCHDTIKALVNDSNLLKFLVKDSPDYWIRFAHHEYHALWVSRYPQSMIILNPILSKLHRKGRIKYHDNKHDNKMEGSDFYQGRNMLFEYKDNLFQWYDDRSENEYDIYLVHNDSEGKIIYFSGTGNEISTSDNKENAIGFNLEWDDRENEDKFIEQLDKLILRVKGQV